MQRWIWARVATAVMTLSVVILGTGCGAGGTVKMDDDRARMPELMISHAINPQVTVSASVNRTTADNAEVGGLEAGQDLKVEDVVIEAPGALSGAFEVDRLALAAGFQVIDDPRLGVRIDAGVHRSDINLTLIDKQGQHHRVHRLVHGTQLGGHITVPLSDRLTGEVYGTRAIYLNVDLGSSREQQWGLRLVFDAHEQVKVFAGWRWSDFSIRSYPSDIELDASGVNAGLALAF